MGIRRGVAMVAVAAVFTVGASACGGDSKQAAADGGAAAPATKQGEGDASLAGEFRSLLDTGAADSWKVTYDMEGAGATARGMTIAVDGKRYAMTMSTEQGDMRMVDDGKGTTYSCVGDQCFAAAGGKDQESPAAAFTEQLEQYEEYARMKGVKTSRDTIAGRDALCGTYSGKEAGEAMDVEYCVDAETGAILRSRSGTSGAGSFSMEATSVETPSAADFEVPEDALDTSKLSEMSLDDLQKLSEQAGR